MSEVDGGLAVGEIVDRLRRIEMLATLANAHRAFLRFRHGPGRALAADYIDFLTSELVCEMGDQAPPPWRPGAGPGGDRSPGGGGGGKLGDDLRTSGPGGIGWKPRVRRPCRPHSLDPETGWFFISLPHSALLLEDETLRKLNAFS